MLHTPRTKLPATIRANGFVADGFDFALLDSLPDLSGRMPDGRWLLSSPAVRNPQLVLGSDPFGLGLVPDFALRLASQLLVPLAGRYRFVMTGYAGARLSASGQTVVEVRGQQGSPATASGEIVLDAGYTDLRIEYFDDIGPSMLVVTWIGPDGIERALEPQSLQTDVPWLTAVTDAQGQFEIRAMPSMLAGVRIGVAAGATTAESEVIEIRDDDIATGELRVGTIAIKP